MAIEIKHLNHIYGQGTIFEQYALKDVNLTIHDGEFIGLIGQRAEISFITEKVFIKRDIQ